MSESPGDILEIVIREPLYDADREEAHRLWLVEYLSSQLAWVWRMLTSSRSITDADLYRLIEIGRIADRIVRCKETPAPVGEAPVPSPAESQEFNRVRRLLHQPLLDLVRALPADVVRGSEEEESVGNRTIYRQAYNGLVRSVGEKIVRIEFDVNGDLVTRKFRREDLDWPGDIPEGAAVRVTTEMEYTPPDQYTPSEAEIERFREMEAEERRIRGMPSANSDREP